MRINKPPIDFDSLTAEGKARWIRWYEDLDRQLCLFAGSGATADRPTDNLTTGLMYFDTTLGYPVWYDGSGWVDATGASA